VAWLTRRSSLSVRSVGNDPPLKPLPLHVDQHCPLILSTAHWPLQTGERVKYDKVR
jgi:hypothetical protein